MFPNRNLAAVIGRSFKALLLLSLLGRPAPGEIVIDPPTGLPKQVSIKRGPVGLHFRGAWSSFSVTTQGGKRLGLVDPVLYGISPEGAPSVQWTRERQGWPRLKWIAVEQGEERDVLYVEGDYEGWRVQAWISMYGQEEAAYVRKRTTLTRGRQTLTNARGVMAIYAEQKQFDSGVIAFVVDDEPNPLPGRNADRYVLFKTKDVSAAAVNPGEQFQNRGKQCRHFGHCRYHPKVSFLELSINQGPRSMKQGDFVESAFVLVWGDGDITERVRAALADPEGFAVRLPSAARPVSGPRPETADSIWPKTPRRAVIKVTFLTPKGAGDRVYATDALLPEPPAMDGVLDDPIWAGTEASRFTVTNTVDAVAELQTSFRVRYDRRAIYLAVQCDQPHLDKVRLAKHRPGKFSSGEQVELFFLSGESVYQLCVDTQGGRFDLRDDTRSVDLVWGAATRKDAAGWTAEVEVPFKSLGMGAPRPFDSMEFNIVRNAGQVDRSMTCSAWNPTKGAHAGTGNFGTLFFGTEDQYRAEQRFFVQATLDRDVYDTLDVAAGAWVEITATADIPEGMKLLTGIADKSGKLLRSSVSDATGSRAKMALDLDGQKEGEYEARFALVVAGKQVADSSSPFRIRKARRAVVGRGKIPVTVRSAHPCSRLPVSTGVPFPKGELRDPGKARLLDERGQEIPCQTSTLATWDPAGSISWLRLESQTPVDTDRPTPLTLEYGVPRKPNALPQSIAITQNADSFRVSTGPLLFTVPRKHGGVLQSAFLDTDGNGTFEDTEQIITDSGGVGPYLVDSNGGLYEAARDKKAEVVLEETGPLKVVFRIESWYESEDGVKLCRHVTRITAYAGLPHLRLEHTWVMTAATGEAAFKDIGFALPTTQHRRVVFGTDDGELFAGFSRFPRYLLQDTDLHYEIHGPHQRIFLSARDKAERYKLRWRTLVEGGKAPGWMAVQGDRAGLVLAVDEFWQNFPKELGLDEGRVTFHVWPKHGRPRSRPVTDATLTKLDFVHGGEALDFKLPPEVAKYRPLDSYEQRFVDGANRANAIGTAKTHRFALTFFPASASISEVQRETRAIADTPCAIADPKWMAQSGVLGPLHPHDPESFPEVEEALELAGKLVPRLNHLGGYYGMWIYGQLHTTYNYSAHRWNIYRIYNQLHHNGPRWPWIMYLRSGDRDYLGLALANTRIVADVGFCHHSRPEFETLSWPKGKTRGALTDYKGLVPWHSGNRNPDYNSLSAFLMWHYYLTGDGWTRDVAMEWGTLAKRQGPAGGHRTGAGTVRAAMDLYGATWDAALIPIYRRSAEALLRSQQDYGAFPEWENYTPWLGEYYELTGQETARRALLKWADAFIEGHGGVSERWGNYMNVIASAYFASGEERYAREARGLLECWCWGIFSDPESHLRGNYPGRGSRSLSFCGFLFPRAVQALEAWARAGKSISPLYPRSRYRSQESKDGVHRMELLILDEDDAPMDIVLGGMVSGREREPEYRIDLRILGPAGTTVSKSEIVTSQRVETAHGSTRAYPRHWRDIRVPGDRKKGVYRLLLSSKDTSFLVTLPVSERREAYPLETPGQIRISEFSNMASLYLPKGVERPRLKFVMSEAIPGTVQIRDPDFNVVEKVHLLGLWQQSNTRVVDLPIPPNHEGGFWTLVGGMPFGITAYFVGDRKPSYFSVWPDRAFRPEDHRVAPR